MGSVNSIHKIEEEEDIWWTNGNKTNSVVKVEELPSTTQTLKPTVSENTSLNQIPDKSNHKFNDLVFDMDRKYEKRREILAAKKKEFEDLREEVRRLTEENEKLKGSKESQENYTKEMQQLQEDNEHLRLLLSTKQSGGVLLEELDKVLRENTTLKGELKDKVEELAKAASLLDKNRELRVSIAEMQSELQNLNTVVIDFEKEREEYKTHVVALKDVINVSKKMLLIREAQLKELREKVESIEETLSGKEMNILSQDLRLEYERQLQSIRNLKALYEERQRSDYREKEELKKLIEETKKELETEQNKNREAEERINELEEINSQKYDQIKSLESNLGLSKAEARQYLAELTVINQLFSEILLGFNSSQEIDLDKLTKHLEDHHELLQNIVINEISPETSFALPKVLLDLVRQMSNEEENKNLIKEETQEGKLETIVEELENKNLKKEETQEGKLETIVEESESQTSTQNINSAEEIVELLPKVWRVLIELLGHQKAPTNILSSENTSDEDPCYKTVQTPKGPSLVLSVSQTFIRLKDLILEKKSLEKETGHLKQLNTHLENRLQDQEKRLGMVTSELNKTWHVVGKMQKQHQLLHTQEKILRYELAQKRKLLTSLREELEYSREKWQEAREKNSKTEKQWRQLRVEFASRRKPIVSDECSTSQESGYSDERASSSDDEPGYETDISESVPKQNEDQEDDPNVETDIPTCDRLSTSNLQQQNIQIPENTVQDRVTRAERRIELANTSIESKLHSCPPSTETSSSTIRETSCCLVSSVVEEAIATILQNSSETQSDEPDPLNSQDLKTGTTKESTSEKLIESESAPTTASSSKTKTLEELLAAKEERLKRLEGQCEQLVQKVTSTTQKSVIISNKLDDLHEVYGDSSTSQARRATNSQENEENDESCDNH